MPFYMKLRGDIFGLTVPLSLGHVAHKLVRVIFKLLKDNIPFNEDKLQKS